MCRLAAYVGPPLPLSRLLYDTPHSLHEQSYTPRLQIHGSINTDGSGIAWWLDGDPEPLRYRTATSLWADANLPLLAQRLEGTTQLAAVRSATKGIPHGPTFAAPFLYGRYAGAHNGFIGAFRQATARPLLARLGDAQLASLDGMSDAQVLFLTAMRHLDEDPDAGLLVAVGRAVGEVAELCRQHDAAATLNLAVGTDGEVVMARVATGSPSNSLFTLEATSGWPGGAVVASEPLDDDPAWREVPDASVVRLTTAGVEVQALAEVGPVR